MAPPPGHGLLLIVLGTLGLGLFARGRHSSTLIFTKENTLRNCSCPGAVRDCDYSLASLLCRCEAALPGAPPPAGYSGPLTIWFTDASALGLLLNFTLVPDLKLALCSTDALPARPLALCGLRRLRVTAQARRPTPQHSLLLGGEPPSPQPCADLSLLDLALFNRASSLKSYSIQNVANIASDLPYFSGLRTFPSLSNQSYLVTFIY